MRRQGGFTLMEMMIATVIMMAVTGAVFQLLDPAQGMFKAQPQVSDMQQRMRVGVETLKYDLMMAGAGSYAGASPGALYNFFAPVMPYRRGDTDDDPAKGVFYRTDAISLLYIPPTAAQTGVNQAFGNNGVSQEFDVDAMTNCGPNKKDQLCGFEEGMRVIVFDVDGSWDVVTITNVQDQALHLQHSGKVNGKYNSGSATITQVAARTYYLKNDDQTQTYQLMRYDGAETDAPVVDNVVKLEFQYFGEPQPPQLIPNKALSDAKGPWTTYGPKPPALGVDMSADDEYLAGENCLFTAANGVHAPRLAVLANGVTEVELDEDLLTDGPWCANATSPTRFDADLLRVRHIRVVMRVQVALEELRGPAGTLFTKGGTSTNMTRYIPDQEIRFDIAPRNMNLGR